QRVCFCDDSNNALVLSSSNSSANHVNDTI
uniref:Ribonuclease P protein subunit p29 n=1 Tax=Parascaris univalens TaxID=6257 RepID=A0A915AZC0_PARUN